MLASARCLKRKKRDSMHTFVSGVFAHATIGIHLREVHSAVETTWESGNIDIEREFAVVGLGNGYIRSVVYKQMERCKRLTLNSLYVVSVSMR